MCILLSPLCPLKKMVEMGGDCFLIKEALRMTDKIHFCTFYFCQSNHWGQQWIFRKCIFKDGLWLHSLYFKRNWNLPFPASCDLKTASERGKNQRHNEETKLLKRKKSGLAKWAPAPKPSFQAWEQTRCSYMRTEIRRNRQGRRDSVVTLYVRECLDFLKLTDGGNKIECLWIRICAKANKALGFWKADFDLSRRLVDRVPWQSVLKGKGVQEGWTFFRKEIFEAWE